MNLWVSHWMGFNGFLEFDFDKSLNLCEELEWVGEINS